MAYCNNPLLLNLVHRLDFYGERRFGSRLCFRLHMKLKESHNLRLKSKAQTAPETKDKVRKEDTVLFLPPSESYTVEYRSFGVRGGAVG